jgi:hypothetical protein
MALLGALFAALLLSAGCDKDSKGSADADPGDTASDPTGDTASDPTGDTASDPTGDTASDDPGDTETDDPGDTASDDPGDTETDDPGDTETDDPGDTETPPPGCASDADCTEPGLGLCIVATGECVMCAEDEDCPGPDVCNDNTCEARCDAQGTPVLIGQNYQSMGGRNDPLIYHGGFEIGDAMADLSIGFLPNVIAPGMVDLATTTEHYFMLHVQSGMQIMNYLLVSGTMEVTEIDVTYGAPFHAWFRNVVLLLDDMVSTLCINDFEIAAFLNNPDLCFDDDDCDSSAPVCGPGGFCAPVADWICAPFWYDNGLCECGCGARDIDCADDTVGSCEYHGCSMFSYPNADENWRCEPLATPPNWTCPPHMYGDDYCDCGCGVRDIDCAGPEASHCYQNDCPSGTAPVDDENWRCTMANPDCSVDADCEGHANGAFCDVDTGRCVACLADGDCLDGESCAPKTKFCLSDAWTCPANRYGDGQCDCGCGALDYDCAGPENFQCDNIFCTLGKLPDADENWRCEYLSVPTDWTCPANRYGDGQCDCGCGALDYDCAGPEASQCDQDDCPSGTAPVDGENWRCYMASPDCSVDDDCVGHARGAFCDLSVGGRCVACLEDDHCVGSEMACVDNVCKNAGWTCNDSWYGDGECDCGCGALDVDCAGPESSYCRYVDVCTNQGLTVDPNENWLCVPLPPVPAEWTCDPDWYGDGFCDCGCGALDYGCAGPYATDCEWSDACTNQGLVPHPDENWLCVPLPPVPAEWTCSDYWYGDGDCDCGCGALDYDCAGPGANYCRGNMCASGTVPHPDENWLCIVP